MEHPVTERFFHVFTYLKDRGLLHSQRDFAQGVGFPETHFHAYKKGQRRFGIQHLVNLYRAYHVNLTYMITGTGPLLEEETHPLK
jgi:hypothetical protein